MKYYFLDAIASPGTDPCQWILSDLEIAIASPSFASLLYSLPSFPSLGHDFNTLLKIPEILI